MAATEALSAQVVRKNPLWLRPLPRLAGIPYLWYAECPNGGIAGERESPYLCTQKI